MKYRKFFEFTMMILVILFLGLYISQMTGYYQYAKNKKTILTNDAMKRFEKDIKEGKEINTKDYLVEETNYNNLLSTLGMKVSSLIEKGFNKAMNCLFNELSKAITNN